MISPVLIRLVSLLVLAIACAFSLFFAIRSGTRQAQTKIVLTNTTAIKQGLEYFNRDNNRYPSVTEFASGTAMGTYVNPYPPHEFASGVCPESFTYKTINQHRYDFRYCLPQALGNQTEGWHAVTE